jgi:membrane protease YdiL (CAAX protease family)
VYQLGVVFLHVRNATDLVTVRLLDLAQGDRLLYLGMTAACGVLLFAVFAALGRGQGFRGSKVAQIAAEGAVYAVAMSAATSWVVGKVFAGAAPGDASGPFAGLVMSLGAGFYEELAFRVLLFGAGAKVLVWLLAGQHVGLVGRSPALSWRALLVMGAWAFACAAAFSGMHYTGSMADAFSARSFVARAVLGLALTLIYGTRGFAAAVWTHALYDVWVLVL